VRAGEASESRRCEETIEHKKIKRPLFGSVSPGTVIAIDSICRHWPGTVFESRFHQ
jgi:hypothetical protein